MCIIILGVLCHYIRTYLGEEHMQRLLDMGGNGNAFIRTPIPTKEMWYSVQSAHIKTLSCCFVIESSPSKLTYQSFSVTSWRK